MPRNGYLAVFLSNATEVPSCYNCGDVFFDQVSITFSQGSLLEENHYYPHGLPMAALSSQSHNFSGSRHRYQGNEQLKELDLGWMDFHNRQYDPQIGRFLSVDPLAAAGGQDRLSPFQAMGNNPVSRVDPLGLMFRSQSINEGMGAYNPMQAAATMFPTLNFNIQGGITPNIIAERMIMMSMSGALTALQYEGDAAREAFAALQGGMSISTLYANAGTPGGDPKSGDDNQSLQSGGEKTPDEVHSGFPGDGRIHVVNDYEGDVYFKPEGDLKLNDFEFKNDGAYKMGAKSWVPLDGVNVNGKVYKISDGYSRIHITKTGEVKVHYDLPIPQIVNWIRGGEKYRARDASWNNLFNVNKL